MQRRQCHTRTTTLYKMCCCSSCRWCTCICSCWVSCSCLWWSTCKWCICICGCCSSSIAGRCYCISGYWERCPRLWFTIAACDVLVYMVVEWVVIGCALVAAGDVFAGTQASLLAQSIPDILNIKIIYQLPMATIGIFQESDWVRHRWLNQLNALTCADWPYILTHTTLNNIHHRTNIASE